MHPADDLSGLRLYIIPHWALFNPEWVPALTEWVRRGGNLVIGARSGTRTPDNQVTAQTPPGVLADSCGVQAIDFGRIDPEDGRPKLLEFDGTG